MLQRALMGSRLHNTHTESSDWDWLELWDELECGRTNTHETDGETDLRRWSLAHLQRMLWQGDSQAWELAAWLSETQGWDLTRWMNHENAERAHLRTAQRMNARGGERNQRHAWRLRGQWEMMQSGTSEAWRMREETQRRASQATAEETAQMLAEWEQSLSGS